MKYILSFALVLSVIASAAPAFAQQQFGQSDMSAAEKKQAQQRYNAAQKKGAAASKNYTQGQAKRDGYGGMSANEKEGYKKGYRTGK